MPCLDLGRTPRDALEKKRKEKKRKEIESDCKQGDTIVSYHMILLVLQSNYNHNLQLLNFEFVQTTAAVGGGWLLVVT